MRRGDTVTVRRGPLRGREGTVLVPASFFPSPDEEMDGMVRVEFAGFPPTRWRVERGNLRLAGPSRARIFAEGVAIAFLIGVLAFILA